MITGFIELMRAFQVRGWAYEPDLPKRRVTVELRMGDRTIGVGEANQFRQDLVDAHIGDGSHGFVINVDEELPLDAPEALHIYARNGQGAEHRLPNAHSFSVEKVSVFDEGIVESGAAIGYFVVNQDEIAGWAYDPRSPAEPLQVELQADGVRIADCVANHFRPDLIAVCEGHGHHGFRFVTERASLSPSASVAAYAKDVDGRSRKLTLIPGGAAPRAEGPPRTETRIVFPTSASDPEQRPIFVLGAARSGTSAIAQALTAATRYRGPEEGHFFDLAMSLVSSVDRFYESRADEGQGVRLAMAPSSFVSDGVKHIFSTFARAAFPTRMWLDKSPRVEMIAAAPLLRQIFPNARFIFMKRRAIENIDSRGRKFPNITFEDHCRSWTACMSTWIRVRDILGSSAIEVDQFTLATHPEAVVNILARGLEMTSNDCERLTKALQNDKPERTSRSLTTCRPLSSYNWSTEDLNSFRNICTVAMNMYGYLLDERYSVGNGLLDWGQHVLTE